MKRSKLKLFLVVLIAALVTVAVILSTVAGIGIAERIENKKLVAHEQQLNYVESVKKIDNPDQGFYRPVFVKMTEDGAEYNQNIINDNTRLYHLRVDISAFSSKTNGKKDKNLTSAALNSFEKILEFLNEKQKNAVVRFAYDPAYGGKADMEPAIDKIEKHIKQLCPVLNKYDVTITAIEAGLIGPWGEMHTSKIANKECENKIIAAFLKNTKNLPVLVRTPKMIYNYLGITLEEAADYAIGEKSAEYRLGIFNDGYLGSANDLGTYTDRQKDIEFLSRQTGHLPYGGEVVVPESNLHNIENCLPEMNTINLSYLNVEWNNQVIDKWKNGNYVGDNALYAGQTAFTYIQNHMGYRFVLEKSTLSYSDKVKKVNVELDVKNVGFGNLTKSKAARLIFADVEGNIVWQTEVTEFTGHEKYSVSVKPALTSGEYGVYISLYGQEQDGAPAYAVQFANDGLWSDILKANLIGNISVVK